MRIVSLLPSATEILAALGLGDAIVGVSHECDFPAEMRSRRVVIQSRIPSGLPPDEIDRLVREYLARGESLYAVDAAALKELRPDLIVTQDLCHVCAASPDDLSSALAQFRRKPEVLCLNPQDLGDVWRDVLLVSERTGRLPAAESLIVQVGKRLGEIESVIDNRVSYLSRHPRVAFLEWLQPLYTGGHWIPEMIRHAGGDDVLNEAGRPSFGIASEDVIAAAPEVIFISPCGYTAERARQEYQAMEFPEEWSAIPAVRNNRVYALEANSYFSRPGPRLVTGIEILATVLYPGVTFSREAATSILPIATAAPAAHSARA